MECLKLLLLLVVAVTGNGINGMSLNTKYLWNDEKRNLLLEVHNTFRSGLQACNMMAMVYDLDLEEQARKWASRCIYGHENIKGRGENIASFAYDVGFIYVIKASLTYWVNEGIFYDPTSDEDCWPACHFTQVVWSITTRVGCFIKQCPYPVGIYLVCFYQPGGNTEGQVAYGTECDRRCKKGLVEKDYLCYNVSTTHNGDHKPHKPVKHHHEIVPRNSGNNNAHKNHKGDKKRRGHESSTSSTTTRASSTTIRTSSSTSTTPTSTRSSTSATPTSTSRSTSTTHASASRSTTTTRDSGNNNAHKNHKGDKKSHGHESSTSSTTTRASSTTIRTSSSPSTTPTSTSRSTSATSPSTSRSTSTTHASTTRSTSTNPTSASRSTTTAKVCEDKLMASCETWLQYYSCTPQFMIKNCQRSCRFCK